MSNKISQLNNLPSLEYGDYFPIVDDSEANNSIKTKRATLGTLVGFLNSINPGNFTDYDPGTTYIGGTTYYVSYNGNIYKFISVTDQTAVTPGTNDTVWELTSAGAFAHEKDKDQYLDYGGSNQVSAQSLALMTKEYTVSTTNNTPTTIHTLATTSNKVYHVSYVTLGTRTGGASGTAGDHQVYRADIIYKNVAGTVTVFESVISFDASANAAAFWNQPAASVSGTNLLIKVTGGTNYNISWKLRMVSFTEL
jgi:hypothetical protein